METNTYQSAGVSLGAADAWVEKIGQEARTTHGPQVLKGIGGFGALFALDLQKTPNPILVSGTDGVGTKLLIAQAINQMDTLGIDLVAMCVNDIITLGAKPLFFLDYFATGKLEMNQATPLLQGIVNGCKEAHCALIGGETAEMPGLYQPGDFDLAGFAVGIVDRADLIDGKNIQPGNVILGISSSGLHSNGFSLVRKILLGTSQKINSHAREILDQRVLELDHCSLGEILLTPTRIYSKTLQNIFGKIKILGLAHITGGGLPGNLPRILPENLAVKINKSAWTIPPIFQLIQARGKVSEDELYRTFNMGIGMTLIVHPSDVKTCRDLLSKSDEKVFVLGEVVNRNPGEPQFELIP